MVKKKSAKRQPQAKSSTKTPQAIAEEFEQKAEPLMAVLNKKLTKATTDEEKAKKLQAYHRLGKLSLQLVPDHGGYGKGVLKQHAEAVGCTYRFLSLARRFANRYTKEDLVQLCAHPIGVSHLRALVDVDDKKLRARLQKKAYSQKLPVAALFKLKRQKIDPKRSGGAPVKTASDPKTALLDLLGTGHVWVRHCEDVLPKLSKISEKGIRDVAEEGIKQLKAIAKAARQAEKELKRLVDDA